MRRDGGGCCCCCCHCIGACRARASSRTSSRDPVRGGSRTPPMASFRARDSSSRLDGRSLGRARDLGRDLAHGHGECTLRCVARGRCSMCRCCCSTNHAKTEAVPTTSKRLLEVAVVVDTPRRTEVAVPRDGDGGDVVAAALVPMAHIDRLRSGSTVACRRRCHCSGDDGRTMRREEEATAIVSVNVNGNPMHRCPEREWDCVPRGRSTLAEVGSSRGSLTADRGIPASCRGAARPQCRGLTR